MSVTMEEALKQSIAINDLFKRLVTAESTQRFVGDRISCQVTAEFVFPAGSTAPGQMTFNVPQEYDFHGSRLNLFLQSKRINISNSAHDDVVWTPARWVQDFSDTTTLPATAGMSFSFSDSVRQSVQTAAVSVISAFSGVFPMSSYTVYPGAIDFDEPYFLPQGSTFTVNLTPTFSTGQSRLFRVVGVFDGWKAVRT